MEWIVIVAGLAWFFGLFDFSSKDDKVKSETECDEDILDLDVMKVDEKLEQVELKKEEIKKDPNTMPTVTRVSGANLKNKLINRPTAMGKRK